jgi:hypothetical protein
MSTLSTESCSRLNLGLVKRRQDPLFVANSAFILAIVLHNTDHIFFQDRGVNALSTEVVVAGTMLAVAAFIGYGFTLARHPWAPMIATILGFGAAVSVTLGHVVPHWSAFSDPYSDLHLGVYSWTVMLAEIVTGFVLGAVGFRTERQRSLVTT